MNFSRALLVAGFAMSSAFNVSSVLAAEGWKVRYPISGALGGEMVAPIKPGWFGSVVLSQIEISGLTGDDGKTLTRSVSGTITTPEPVLGVVRTASYSGIATIDMEQSQTLGNMVIGYMSDETLGGGNLSFVVNVPYARSDRTTLISGETPILSPLTPAITTPPFPEGTAEIVQTIAQGQFDTTVQAKSVAASEMATGVVEGWGDTELTAAWVYSRDAAWKEDALKFVAGLTLVAPTGEYDKDRTAGNIGFGNFYTVRAGAALSNSFQNNWTLGARGSIASNGRNKDNDWRSGNYWTLDLAAAYRTQYGVLGPHILLVKQFQDDSGGAYGSNRYESASAGVFFTTRIAALNAGLNIAYMKTLDTKNAFDVDIYQLRLSKAF